MDSFQTVRKAGIKASTGLMMTYTDEELMHGSKESIRLHDHRAKHHPDQTPPPIYYPAKKPLLTEAECRLWRNAQSGSYKKDGWLFKSFVQAHRYATGKPALTKQGYTIQRGKAPRRS